MQTALHSEVTATAAGRRAEEILRACVHCGFCNATCPTYQLTGDERDGPRGRIYLVKLALEDPASASVAMRHLDRCLTCRSCETTCPSGVAYGELAEIGRGFVERRADRGLVDRLVRAALVAFVPRRSLFRLGALIGSLVRLLLPRTLAEAVPVPRARGRWARPESPAERRVLVLEGCVQSVATPGVNCALAALLARLGVEAVRVADEGCCGSLALHLAHDDTALAHMRRNAEALARHVGTIEAILSTASGCGVTVREYGRHLAGTTQAETGAWVAQHVLDAAEYLLRYADRVPRVARPLRVAFQSPCSLQHGSRVNGAVETLLTAAGHTLVPVADGHLCCGSAGTYSLLQRDFAHELRARKLVALGAGRPDVIATANVGCALHLGATADVPVRHWLELMQPEES
jgi:glycolate oxidase iron-sulfur subunit